MSNILFLENCIIDLSDLNIEMAQYYAKQWNLEHTVMEKGPFTGSISAVHTPRIQIGTSYYSHGLMSRGDFPDGCILLVYAANNAVYNFQNRVIKSNEIIVLNKGDEINMLFSGDINIHTVAIEEQLFNQSFYDFFDISPSTIFKHKRVFIKPDMMYSFPKTIDNWRAYLTNKLHRKNIQSMYNRIESEILQQLFTHFVFSSATKKRKKFNTQSIRDLLHSKIEQYIDIPDILKELNISESQLHYLFKKEYGITPKKYLQYLRLNAIKKELLLADPHSVNIAEIAQKYNFFHMSHFSLEYKKLFGQTPSKTLSLY